MKQKGFFSTGLRIAIVIFLAVIFLFVGLNQFYINILWFKEVNYLQVFFKSIVTKLTMGIPLFAALFIILGIYFKLLTKSGGKTNIILVEDKKKFIRGKLPYLLSVVVSAVISIMITSSLWYKWLEYSNSVPFNVTDPIFNKDIAFYVFKLPFYQGLLNIGYTVLIVLFASTLIYSFLVIADKTNDDKKFQGQFDFSNVPVKGLFTKLWSSFRVQLSIFLSLFFVLAAISTYLKRFDLLYSSDSLVYGATYTDVHVMMPFYLILSILCIVTAFATLYFGMAKKLKPLLITGALLIGVNLLGVIAGSIVQGYVVSPNEFSKEQEYINYNIAFTQKAYGIENIEVKDFAVEQNITAQDIINNEAVISNIPINDYRPTLDTYNSLQGIRPYYEFKDIDVDRYYLNGKYTEVFISSREMNNSKLETSAQTWINLHLKYTHGFGITVSPVNQVTATGQPMMIAKDIPPVSNYAELNVAQPRIYFGEGSDTYAVVNTKAKEFDYPAGNDNQENIYDGTAGIALSFINRISFALSNGTVKFLLSSDITSESKILINRNVLQRVQKIAPFFSYDSDPYIVNVDGKLYWILDAITTTDRYPYSQPYNNQNPYNYIRNSVKVVVDAYNGDVTFYQIDANDPIASVYGKIYPNLLKSLEEMPEGIKSHLRYSETLFNIQADIYKVYHMNNPSVFYNKEDLWQIATQFYQTSKDPIKVNSTYLITKLPGRQQEFMLMVPFTPQNKDNMVAWMAGICDGDQYGQLVIYQFPKQKLVYGPMQIEQRIDQDTVISPQLTLLSQQGSEVIRGNLLTIPIGDGLLYVEPVYVQASGGDRSLPEAKKIIACYGDNIVMANTLGEALNQIFGIKQGGTTTTPISTDSTTAELIARANELYTNAQAALKAGDWTSYGNYMNELGQVLGNLKNK